MQNHYEFGNTVFITAHEYLLKSIKLKLQKNKTFDLMVGSPILFVNFSELIPELCIRTLLPRNYGGIESPTVMIIDGNTNNYNLLNKIDFHNCVEQALKYGMDINSVLERIIITRSFTIYQLANIIIYDLSKLIKKYKSNLVIITIDLFTINEKQFSISEKQRLLHHIIKKIHNISDSIIVVFSSIEIEGFRKMINHKNIVHEIIEDIDK